MAWDVGRLAVALLPCWLLTPLLLARPAPTWQLVLCVLCACWRLFLALSSWPLLWVVVPLSCLAHLDAPELVGSSPEPWAPKPVTTAWFFWLGLLLGLKLVWGRVWAGAF